LRIKLVLNKAVAKVILMINIKLLLATYGFTRNFIGFDRKWNADYADYADNR